MRDVGSPQQPLHVSNLVQVGWRFRPRSATTLPCIGASSSISSQQSQLNSASLRTLRSKGDSVAPDRCHALHGTAFQSPTTVAGPMLRAHLRMAATCASPCVSSPWMAAMFSSLFSLRHRTLTANTLASSRSALPDHLVVPLRMSTTMPPTQPASSPGRRRSS